MPTATTEPARPARSAEPAPVTTEPATTTAEKTTALPPAEEATPLAVASVAQAGETEQTREKTGASADSVPTGERAPGHRTQGSGSQRGEDRLTHGALSAPEDLLQRTRLTHFEAGCRARQRLSRGIGRRLRGL